MRRAEVMADLVCSDQAVKGRVASALAQAGAELPPAKSAGKRDAHCRTIAASTLDVLARPQVGEAVCVLVRFAVTVGCQLVEKIAGSQRAGLRTLVERVRRGARIAEYLHQRHVDLDADLGTEYPVDIVQALEDRLLRICSVDTGELRIADCTDIDFRSGCGGLRRCRAEFCRQ